MNALKFKHLDVPENVVSEKNLAGNIKLCRIPIDLTRLVAYNF